VSALVGSFVGGALAGISTTQYRPGGLLDAGTY
jgi:hypothetical protein